MAKITGTSGKNILTGTEEDDLIRGLGGNDTLKGRAGNDEIFGGAGDDTIFGGAGNDKVYDFEGRNTIDLGAGDDLFASYDPSGRKHSGSIYVNGGSGVDYASFDLSHLTSNLTFTLSTSAKFVNAAVTVKNIERIGISGGSGNDKFTGGSRADYFFGDEGNDTLTGLDGNDTLNGYHGDDKLYGGNGNDEIEGGRGNDMLDGGDGDDRLSGGEGDSTIYGGNGNDWLSARGNSTLVGGDGDDTISYDIASYDKARGGHIDAGAGADRVAFSIYAGRQSSYTIDLGSDNDTFAFSAPEGLRSDVAISIEGGDGIDRVEFNFSRFFTRDLTFAMSASGSIVGTAMTFNSFESVKLISGRGNDNLTGGDLDDELDGGLGNDTLSGGDGNDTLLISGGYGSSDQSDDRVDGGAGDDVIDAYNLAPGDVVSIDGGEGFDTAYLRFQNVSDGMTVVASESGSYTILSATLKNIENLSLIGGRGHDSFTGGGGNNAFNGRSGNDTLTGGGGDDDLIGHHGRDKLYGDDGNDTLFGGTGNDILYGGSGKDWLFGEDSKDTLDGGDGKDTLDGGARTDILRGGKGDDLLKGGSDNDQLTGGLGMDKLYGGSGSDIFIFETLQDSTPGKSGRDTIFYFSKGDRIDVSAIDASTKEGGDQGFTFVGTNDFSKKAGELRYDKGKSDTYIRGDVDGDGKADFAIHLDDVRTLDKADFIL